MYGAVVALRNLLYDRRLARIHRISVPVISVGNISAGGTGKTPFVVELVSILQNLGKKPAIVSRGYGRKSSGFQVVSNGKQKCAEATTAGDEPAFLAERLQNVPVVVDEKRARGAEKVVELFAPDVVVLDDGFQHRALFRDCDIVLVTPAELGGHSHLLPAGYGREPIKALQRAHVCVVSKSRDFDEFEAAATRLKGRVDLPTIGLRTSVAEIRRFRSSEKVAQDVLRGKKVVAFSGIADGSSFDRTIGQLGANLLAHHRFEDHHWYTEADMKNIVESFRISGAEFLVTTEKDMVKLGDNPDSLGSLALYSVGIRSEIISGKEELVALLKTILGGK